MDIKLIAKLQEADVFKKISNKDRSQRKVDAVAALKVGQIVKWNTASDSGLGIIRKINPTQRATRFEGPVELDNIGEEDFSQMGYMPVSGPQVEVITKEDMLKLIDAKIQELNATRSRWEKAEFPFKIDKVCY